MVDRITTNPQRSEPVVDEKGLPNNQLVEYMDDIELGLNSNLLGDSVIHRTYKLNQTPSELPDAEQNVEGIILVSGVQGLNFSVPAFSAEGDSTEFSIINVTDVGGVAQFNISPSIQLELNRQVVISGFVGNPTYNGIFKITDLGTGFFRISSIAFTGSETAAKFKFGSDWRDMFNFEIVI